MSKKLRKADVLNLENRPERHTGLDSQARLRVMTGPYIRAKWERKGCRATYFKVKNTPVVGLARLGQFRDMKTVSIMELETVDQQEQRERADKQTLGVHWEDSEWFKVWLKLAREEERTPAAVC